MDDFYLDSKWQSGNDFTEIDNLMICHLKKYKKVSEKDVLEFSQLGLSNKDFLAMYGYMT